MSMTRIGDEHTRTGGVRCTRRGFLQIGAGITAGMAVPAVFASRGLQQAETDWQVRYDKSLTQIENLKTQNKALENSVESEREQGLKFKHAAIQSKTELESVRAPIRAGPPRRPRASPGGTSAWR